MKSWHFVIDVAQCEDCNNCSLACKDEHVDNDWPGYSKPQPRHGHRWMDVMRHERGQFPMIDVAYRPTTCMQCNDAPCTKASNAVYRRNDGIVMIDPTKALGQKDLVKACPYNAIWWNETHNVPQKCTFCAHLIDDGWTKPRCAQACPTGALQAKFVEEPEMNRIVDAEQLEVLYPELKTQPQVYYKNLYRFSHCFIGGSVAVESDGLLDCADGAVVTLYQGQKEIAKTATDNYGDFKFDRLVKNSGDYSLIIEVVGCGRQTVQVPMLKGSVNLGTINFVDVASLTADTSKD
jgi:Fe-S-cluster-containing dehydrogenase component